VSNPDDLGRGQRVHTEVSGPFTEPVPHHPGPQSRVVESVDQGRYDFTALCPVTEQGISDGRHEIHVLDPLGGPVRADLATRDAPDLFRIGLEKDLIEASSKTIDDPVLEVPLRAPGRYLCAQVAGDYPSGLHRPELAESLHGTQRIVEKHAVKKDPRHPRALDKVLSE